MAGFTPGPWEWSTNFNGYETVLRGRAGAAVLVPDSRDGAPPWVDVSDDDARLIAAAPDLYEALKLCAALWVPDTVPSVVRAALAKATGGEQ